MDISTLNYFVCTYNEKSISKAALLLHISQQGLSKSIHALETELDVPLFYRSKTGVTPTEFGDSFYIQAQVLLNDYHNMLSTFQKIKDEKKGIIRIGLANAVVTALEIGLPLFEFISSYPNIQIENINETDSICEKMLLEEKLDIAFVMGPVNSSQINYLHLFSEKINVFLHKDHPLADKKALTIHDIKNEPLISADKKSRGYSKLVKLFQDCGYTPNIIFTTNDPATSQQLILQKAGIAVLPAHFSKFFEQNDNHIVNLTIDNMEFRKIYMAYTNFRIRTPIEKLFIDYISNYYKGPSPKTSK